MLNRYISSMFNDMDRLTRSMFDSHPFMGRDFTGSVFDDIERSMLDWVRPELDLDGLVAHSRAHRERPALQNTSPAAQPTDAAATSNTNTQVANASQSGDAGTLSVPTSQSGSALLPHWPRMFEGAFGLGALAASGPIVDVREQDGQIHLTAEMPAWASEADVKLEILPARSPQGGHVLKLSGAKAEENVAEDKKEDQGAVWSERRIARTSFERSFRLPPSVQPEQVHAAFSHSPKADGRKLTLAVTFPAPPPPAVEDRPEPPKAIPIPIASGSRLGATPATSAAEDITIEDASSQEVRARL